MKKILSYLSKFLKCRVIRGEHGEPYLERYAIFRSKFFSIYLHHFVASDPDRGLHDHPFRWNASLILSGYYYEVVAAGRDTDKPVESYTVKRNTWDFLTFDSYHRHRVVLLSSHRQPQDCWTLFMHGHRSKGWGFYATSGEYTPVSTGKDDSRISDIEWQEATRGGDGKR